MVLIVLPSSFISKASSDTINIETKLKNGPFESSLYFPDNTTVIFSDNSKICPDNDCKYEFTNGTFSPSALGKGERYLSGTLKIEDKATSTPNFTSYKYYKIGGTMAVAGTKASEKITDYRGDLGLDTEDPIFYPELKYDSMIIYDGKTNLFSLLGISK